MPTLFIKRRRLVPFLFLLTALQALIFFHYENLPASASPSTAKTPASQGSNDLSKIERLSRPNYHQENSQQKPIDLAALNLILKPLPEKQELFPGASRYCLDNRRINQITTNLNPIADSSGLA